jgi:hypothetical protein
VTASPESPLAASSAPSADAPSISLTYEVFSLPIVKAGEINRRGLSDPELYWELVNTAKLERFQIVRLQSEARIDAVLEYRYPSGFATGEKETSDPGEVQEGSAPKSKDDKSANPAHQKKSPVRTTVRNQISFYPTDFELRECGDKLHLTATVVGNRVGLDLKPEHVLCLESAKYYDGQIEQPRIGVLRFQTESSAELGKPRLIATMNPWFAKVASVPAEISRKEQDIWFCFITASLPRDTPSGEGKVPR